MFLCFCVLRDLRDVHGLGVIVFVMGRGMFGMRDKANLLGFCAR